MALAVIFGYKTMVQLIAKNKKTVVDLRDKNGWNLLHYCARYDRLEIMDMIFRKSNLSEKGQQLNPDGMPVIKHYQYII